MKYNVATLFQLLLNLDLVSPTSFCSLESKGFRNDKAFYGVSEQSTSKQLMSIGKSADNGILQQEDGILKSSNSMYMYLKKIL